MSSDKNSFISSNFIKEVHKLGGDVSNFVSKNTINILNKKNTLIINNLRSFYLNYIELTFVWALSSVGRAIPF